MVFGMNRIVGGQLIEPVKELAGVQGLRRCHRYRLANQTLMKRLFISVHNWNLRGSSIINYSIIVMPFIELLDMVHLCFNLSIKYK